MNDHTKRKIARIAHEAGTEAMRVLINAPYGYTPPALTWPEMEPDAVRQLDEAVAQNFVCIPEIDDTPTTYAGRRVFYATAKAASEILS